MAKEIIQLGNPVLREHARKLTTEEILSDETQKLIATMKETMRAAPGVGLAAPQIGIPIQLAVIEDREDLLNTIPAKTREERERQPVKFHVIINPKIVEYSVEKVLFFEGCLSVKGRSRVTERSRSVKVECLDEKGLKKTIVGLGWYARILQHEIDHLNGRLYVDIADERFEIELNEENIKKWAHASKSEINDFYTLNCIR